MVRRRRGVPYGELRCDTGWRPMGFYFFKQKPAYEIPRWLEFRRVLFRSDLDQTPGLGFAERVRLEDGGIELRHHIGEVDRPRGEPGARIGALGPVLHNRSEHTAELQSPCNLVCRLLLEKK